MLRLNDRLLQWRGVGGNLLLVEFTRPAPSMRLQPACYPLLERACTNEWLRPCLEQHRDQSRDKRRLCTLLQDVLGQQQAATTAALHSSLSKSKGCPGRTALHQGLALQPADKTQALELDSENPAIDQSCTGRICCPSLSSGAPIPAISHSRNCIHLHLSHNPRRNVGSSCRRNLARCYRPIRASQRR